MIRTAVRVAAASCLAAATIASATVLEPRDPPPDLLASAKEAVSHDMFDPSSAQFRGIVFYPLKKGGSICGEVNAKNRYGAYVGFRRFVWMESITEIESPSDNGSGPSPFRIMYTALCKPQDIKLEEPPMPATALQPTAH